MADPARRRAFWQQTLLQVRSEFSELPGAERSWVRARLAELADLQGQLHALFLAADGEAVCAACGGECCARGTYHLTLANLLWLLAERQEVPDADFSRTCPWLGDAGCQLSVSCRPFNCVTFVCEAIEARLDQRQVGEFYRLEKVLRRLYLEFSKRFSGGSPYGLLNIAERLGGEPLLRRP